MINNYGGIVPVVLTLLSVRSCFPHFSCDSKCRILFIEYNRLLMLWNKKDSLPLYPINSEKTLLYPIYL